MGVNVRPWSGTQPLSHQQLDPSTDIGRSSRQVLVPATRRELSPHKLTQPEPPDPGGIRGEVVRREGRIVLSACTYT